MGSLVESSGCGSSVDDDGRGILASISFFASLRNASLFPYLSSWGKDESWDVSKKVESKKKNRQDYHCCSPFSEQFSSSSGFKEEDSEEDSGYHDKISSGDSLNSHLSNGDSSDSRVSHGDPGSGKVSSDQELKKRRKEDIGDSGCEKQCSERINQGKDVLVPKEEVPEYLQFNPWILRGYRRPNMSSLECIKSLFYFHNESVNILTHVISFLLFAFIMPGRLPWNDGITRPMLAYCTIVGSFSSWVGSSMYHLFMNHKKGEGFYDILLMIDVIGIWITQTIGATTTITTSVLLYDSRIQAAFGMTYLFLSLRALKDVLTANSVWTRILGFSYLFILRIIAFGLRIHAVPRGAASPLIHIVMQEGWALLGSVISATRIPERWFPGRFDYLLNSHNLMHLFVVFGALHMHAATSADLLWIKDIDTSLDQEH